MDNMLNDNNEWKVGASAVLFILEDKKYLNVIGWKGLSIDSESNEEAAYVPVWIGKIQKVVGKNNLVKFDGQAYKIDDTGEIANRYHEYSRRPDSDRLSYEEFIKLLISEDEIKKYQKIIEEYKLAVYKWDQPWEFKEKPDPWEIPDKK